jgi:hypothetical protein
VAEVQAVLVTSSKHSLVAVRHLAVEVDNDNKRVHLVGKTLKSLLMSHLKKQYSGAPLK